MVIKKHARRADNNMAEKVQYGISLLHVAGVLEAQRYLVNNGVPAEVVARVLSATTGQRRVFGTHVTVDR